MRKAKTPFRLRYGNSWKKPDTSQPDRFCRLRSGSNLGGKLIDAWATESDWDSSKFVSNTFSMEWPKGSRRVQTFPEVDRAEWFEISEAARRILPGQRGFLDELYEKFSTSS